MAGFLNAELIAIRDSLVCGCCNQVFKGSDSQARKVKYEQQAVYCSRACRSSKQSEKLSRPIPYVAQCKHCDTAIYSRNPKKLYCNQTCYSASSQFLEMIDKNLNGIRKQNPVKKAIRELNSLVSRVIIGEENTLVALRAKGTDHLTATSYAPVGEVFHCLECSKPKYAKPSEKRNFCSARCYHVYKGKRFARRITNPEPLVAIGDYEAFLNRDILTCIVDGCAWEGQHLSLHVNLAHGITARELKKIFGFNLATGIVGKDLSNRYSERALEGVAKFLEISGLDLARLTPRTDESRKRSLQGKENAIKARAVLDKVEGPVRVCQGCKTEFKQSTVFGRAKYCTKSCRALSYQAEAKLNAKVAVRNPDGTFHLWVKQS